MYVFLKAEGALFFELLPLDTLSAISVSHTQIYSALDHWSLPCGSILFTFSPSTLHKLIFLRYSFHQVLSCSGASVDFLFLFEVYPNYLPGIENPYTVVLLCPFIFLLFLISLYPVIVGSSYSCFLNCLATDWPWVSIFNSLLIVSHCRYFEYFFLLYLNLQLSPALLIFQQMVLFPTSFRRL